MNTHNDILLIILFIFLLLVVYKKYNKKIILYKLKKQLTYYSKKQDSGSKLLRETLNKYNIRQTSFNNWDIYLPSNNDFSNKSMDLITTSNKNQILGLIHNNKLIGSKQLIWMMLLKYYNRDYASQIMPKSYTMVNDKHIFLKDYTPQKTYIMKSEKQRQEGLKFSTDYKEIINCRNNDFVIVQEYQHNPFVFNDHKVNFRIYLLVIIDSNNKYAYVFDDGIVSYAKHAQSKVSTINNFDNGVSSFYSSKKLYDNDYPITFKHLKKTLPNENWDKVKGIFHKRLGELMKATLHLMGNKEYNHKVTSFQLFGVDLFLNKQMNDCKILEVNIGPGMTPYKEEDRIMRNKLHYNILMILHCIPDHKSNGFTKLNI